MAVRSTRIAVIREDPERRTLSPHAVETVLSLLAQGASSEEILDDYPKLEPNDIRACIAYAHAVIAGDTLAAVSVERR